MNALIMGVSTGIGNSLAKLLLQKGFKVFGLSRAIPKNLITHSNFKFQSVDLNELDMLSERVKKFIINDSKIESFQYVFLNAGQFSQQITNMNHVPVKDLEYLMNVNVWGHKIILDSLLNHNVSINTCILSSSIAGVRARAGNSGYAISKATLNMMAKLYALEHPEIFFSVLGLCNVDTFLSHTIGTLPLEGDFPEIVKLRERASTAKGYLVTADERAENILQLLETDLKKTTSSGEFVEIRDLLKHRTKELI